MACAEGSAMMSSSVKSVQLQNEGVPAGFVYSLLVMCLKRSSTSGLHPPQDPVALVQCLTSSTVVKLFVCTASSIAPFVTVLHWQIVSLEGMDSNKGPLVSGSMICFLTMEMSRCLSRLSRSRCLSRVSPNKITPASLSSTKSAFYKRLLVRRRF